MPDINILRRRIKHRYNLALHARIKEVWVTEGRQIDLLADPVALRLAAERDASLASLEPKGGRC